ncbi:MAG: hypothetical protein K0S32_2279 [Bacteroidetes bacterium]|jgi:hypothetical protein|nr:hypothetical protein [Bacteroidota bacterium]
MKKYIFATLTFIAGFIGLVMITTFLIRGILVQTLLITLIFASTAYVYRKLKSMEPGLEDENNPDKLTENEKESFHKALDTLDYEEYGITEILVGRSKNKNTDYGIVIRTKGGLFNHTEAVKKSLGKEFRSKEQFEIFLNPAERELPRIMKSVYRMR